MVAFSSLAVAFTAIAGAMALPGDMSGMSKRQTALTSSSTGTSGGYYYSFWTNGQGTVSYTNGDAGEYSVTWDITNTNGGDFTCGKGWNPGSAQAIDYTADFQTGGNAYLAVYGWTTDPLVEYYIMDNYGDYNPGNSMTHKGTVTSDGATYDIYYHQQVSQPSILGTSTFDQFWSIRQSKRSSGTITTSNHFNAWAGLGMQMGTFNYQIVLTEGYESSGTSTVTVGGSTTGTTPPSSGTTGTSPPPSTGTGSTGGTSSSCSAVWGQCGGIGWTGPSCCVSGTTCNEQNSYYSQCLPN